MGPDVSPTRRILGLVALIMAGEAIFGLPFHVARFFRPTLLAAFDLTNTDLGNLFAAYGVIAMICYVPGGPLADRFSARKLMSASLFLTGAVGFYMATLPSLGGLQIVFAFFGVTTILLFWAALIRATREWGGSQDQGKAFGILDGGRGLYAAGLASLALIPFSWAFPEDAAAATQADRIAAIRNVVYVYTVSTVGAAIAVWFLVPEPKAASTGGDRLQPRQILEAFKSPTIWLQAIIVVCAYSAYKGLDDYSLFAVEAYGMDEIAGARVSVISAWVRPVAAVGAGLLADRIRPTRAAMLCFAILVGGYGVFVLTEPSPDAITILWANVIVTCAVVYGLRGVYFALMEEVKVPTSITGTAVGIISLVGFTPDIFVGRIAGELLDRSPGAAGHQHFFMVLGAFAVAGFGATWALSRLAAAQRAPA